MARTHIFGQKRIRRGDTTTPYWFPSQTSSGSIREDRIVLPIPPGTHWSDAKPMILPGAENEEPRRLPAPKQKKPKNVPVIAPTAIAAGGLRFAVSKADVPEQKPKREPKSKPKNDPRLVAAARELRDRWLEKVNSAQFALPSGKYDVSRELESVRVKDIPLLAA